MVISDKMKRLLICIVLFLTLLGTSTASEYSNREGVKVIENAEELFYRRFSIDEDFGNNSREAMIDVHLKSIDMLVSVRVDPINKINSITTTYVPGKTTKNETEPEKAMEKDKIVTNRPQNTSITNTSLPRVKITPAKQQVIQHRSAGNSSTWLQKAWNSISSALESVMKWLYYGIEWPKDINSDMFARRTVTRSEPTCPADGTVNHSMFNLDITSMDAETTCPRTSRIHLLTLNNGNPWSQKSQNVTTEESEVITTMSASHLEREANDSVSLGTQNAVTNVKENGPSKRQEPTVVFMEHCDQDCDKKDEKPEPLPEFVTLDFFSSNPKIVFASPLQSEDDDSMFPDNVDIDDLQEEDDYLYWPVSPPEFATVGYYGMVPREQVSEDLDETDNLENNGSPSVSKTSFEQNHSKEKNESWPLKNSEIETPVLVEEGHTSTAVDKETLPNTANPQNHTIKHIENTDECNEDVNTSAVTDTPSNGTVTNEHLKMCPNHPVDAGYWLQEDKNGVCIKEHENFDLSISDLPTLNSPTREDTPMQVTPVKNVKNKWKAKVVIDESVFCLAGLNKSGPETKYCTRKANRRSPESPWFTTKIWNKCIAAVGWLKSSVVPQQATQAKKAQDKWMAKASINVSEKCITGLNKSGPITEFYTTKAARRSSDSSWFITKLFNRVMTIVGWHTSSVAPVQATRLKKAQDKWMADIPVNVFEICMAALNKSGPETEFCTKKAARRLADSQWFTTKLWNKGVTTMRWLKSNETQENARNFTNFYWTKFKITMMNWGWQDTFDVMIIAWVADYYFMAVYLTTEYITELSIDKFRQWRLRREIRQRELEDERERLRQLELKRERAAQPKPWRPKAPKKKRPNYCGRLQKW